MVELEGQAWVIQHGYKWMNFTHNSRAHTPWDSYTPWTCTHLGDARMFQDPEIAAVYVRMYNKDKEDWVIRKLLVAPKETK